MNDRPVYVWRLDVTISDGVTERHRDDEDLGWFRVLYGFDYEPGPDPDERPPAFQWPQRRQYLAGRSAERQAARLRALGATVDIRRSFGVQWPRL